MPDPTRSEYDASWPPAPPPKGRLAETLGDWVQWKNDRFFGFLRLWKPILKLPGGGPVFVTRFRDVEEVLSRPDVFGVTYGPMMDPSVGKFMLGHDDSVFNERDKGIMRALVRRDDLPAVAKKVDELAAACIEHGTHDGTLEVIGNVSRMVPVLLTETYFGFEGPDVDTMMRWSRATQFDMFHNQTMSGEVHDKNIRAAREMRAHIRDVLLPLRRRQLEEDPVRDDVVSRMVRLQTPASVGWDEDRILTNIMGLLVGGIETTSQAVVQIIDQLLSRPMALEGARQAALHGDMPRLARYCWEALRFNPINPVVFRMCNEDYRLAAGHVRSRKIEKGRVMVVGTRSAMKDPRVVRKPKKFDVHRPDSHYFHLGYGAHRCLGDHVSQVQVPGIVKAFLQHENLRRAPGSAGRINFRGGPFPERFFVRL